MPRTRRGPTVTVVATLLLVGGLVAPQVSAPAHAAPASGDPAASPADGEQIAGATAAAVGWLSRQQRRDGTFGDPARALEETTAAILALSEHAQTSDEWSPRSAVDGVSTAVAAGDGPNPLRALDPLTGSGLTPGQTATLLARVAEPLSLSLTEFDPAGDGDPVDLVEGTLAVGADGDLADVARAVTALTGAGEIPPGALVDALLAGRTDGAWRAQDGTRIDVSLTSAALVALVAAGTAPDDPIVVDALTALVAAQRPDGGWGSGDEADPAETAAAIVALRVAGHDTGSACWAPEDLGGADRPDPVSTLLSLQADDGHFGSVDAVAPTSAAVHALSGAWRPEGTTAPVTCDEDLEWPLPAPPAFFVLALIAGSGTFGGLRILRTDVD